MDKDVLIQKIKNKQYNHEQLISWLQCLPASPGKIKPNEFKVGDVLMHSVFKHPYILLKKRKEDWVCGLLTSEEDCPEILEACQSRFFINSYITKVLFTTTEIRGGFLSTYGNTKHLSQILVKLKTNLK